MGGSILSMPKFTCYWLMIACLTVPVTITAAEISPFKVTDIDGVIIFRYLFDEQSLIAQGVTSRKETLPTFQQEYAVNTQSYIFHPNMLNMNLGGSLLYDQSDFESLDGEFSSNSQLVNYFARLNFLEKKSYPFSLYYDQQNPSISTGLAGRYIQENTRYGFDFSLLQPFSPVQVTIGAFTETSLGEGSDQIVNDVRDQSNIRLYHSYGSGNHMQLSHQFNRLDSRSGSPNLPIQPRIFTTESINFDTRNIFGMDKQFQLTNVVGYSTQDEFPVRKDLRFNPNLNWRHSEILSSFYRYDFSKFSEESLDTENQRMTLGVAHTDKMINSNLEIHGQDNEATGLEFQNYGGIFSLNYAKPVSIGKLGLTYSGAYDRNDQKSSVSVLPKAKEEHVLIGTTAVDLLNQFIVTNNAATPVKVYNSDFQLLVEGLDYRLIIIGSTVQVQRRVRNDGIDNIIDDIILVDYSYETGGTFQYDMTNHNIGLNLDFARYYDVYFRYLNSRQQLREGNPTVPLNSISRSTVGVRADKPLSNGMTTGGEASYEDNNEDISSYVRENYDAFIEMPLPQLTDMRLSARRVVVDNENTDEDVDLYGYLLRINSRPWLRTALSLESSYENDTGGTIDRLIRQHRLQIGWRMRQLNVSFNALYVAEEQGDADRERWSVKLVAKREF